MPATSLGASKYVMIYVDDLSRFKIIRFQNKKSDAVAALRNIIAEYIIPAGLKIGSIRTDEGGKFEGEFQQVLDSHVITYELTPPDTPQYNGVAGRALGLLREKSIVMLQEMTVAARDRLWAEALNHACDMSNMCVTSSLEGGTSPYEKWYGRQPSLQHLQPFGTVRYARKGKSAHKLAPRGEQCIVLGIAHNHPRDTVKVLVAQAGQILNRKTVSWHPETAPGGLISPAPVGDNGTAELVGVRGRTIEAHTPTQLAQEMEEESESSEPPRSPGPQRSEQMEAGTTEESSDQESEPMVEPATIPAAVRISQITSRVNCHPPYMDGRGVAVALTAALEAEKSMEDLPHSVACTGKDGQI